jgi:uncharacterized protein (DUF2141 family)
MHNENRSALIRVSSVIRVPLIVFSIIALYSSCAQILVPNGGDKDMMPPKVVKYMPDSAAINFRSKEINIVFNEYVQLKDVSNQLIISPLMDEMPEIKLVKNKILNITFTKPLKENTTYTLNFGNSIADYNEGNVLEGFRYIFSTGSFIDSLSVSGKVDQAFDHKTDKGILVMLYEDQSDSAPYKLLPSYFTKTKADGSFSITNMHPGKYKIFALKDLNKNYKYDAESEDIAFADELVEAGSKKQIELHLFKEVPKKLKVVTVRAEGYGHVLIVFNKPPPQNLKVTALNVSRFPTEILDLSKYGDTLHYWYAGVEIDSLKLQLSEADKIFDTLEVKLITKETMAKTSKGAKLKFRITSNVVPGQKFDLGKRISLKFSEPALGDRIADTSKLLFFIDSARQSCCYHMWGSGPTSSFFDHHNKNDREDTLAGKKIRIVILPGAYTSIFGSTNDTVNIRTTFQELKFYGTLQLKLTLPEKGNYYLQFIDSKETVIAERPISENKTIDYTLIPPGAYKFKLIYDENNNGKWDAGDYLHKKQPEKVIYYDQPITIRSNWDLEIEWKVQ